MTNLSNTYISRNGGICYIGSSPSRDTNVNICDGTSFSGACNILTNSTQSVTSTVNIGSNLSNINIGNSNNYAKTINIGATNAGTGVVSTNTTNIGSNMSTVNINAKNTASINIGNTSMTKGNINVGTTTMTGNVVINKSKVGPNGLTIQNIRFGNFSTGTPTNDFPNYTITHGLGSIPIFSSAILDKTGYGGYDVFSVMVNAATSTTIILQVYRIASNNSNNTGWGNSYSVKWMAFN